MAQKFGPTNIDPQKAAGRNKIPMTNCV